MSRKPLDRLVEVLLGSEAGHWVSSDCQLAAAQTRSFVQPTSRPSLSLGREERVLVDAGSMRWRDAVGFGLQPVAVHQSA